MDKHVIFGVHVTERTRNAGRIQSVLTKHGCQIRTRLGLHDADESRCSPNGLILLEVVGKPAQVSGLEKGLKSIRGLEVKRMTFGR
ncbi:MAG: hypothetical protein WC969_02450 [Elusimicrobiota bacterium]|jgi:hypothetical protein